MRIERLTLTDQNRDGKPEQVAARMRRLIDDGG